MGDFLAHVGQLFRIILNRNSRTEVSEEVFLLVLMHCDQRFTYPWQQLGVETVSLGAPGETLDRRLVHAQKFIELNQITDVIWVCHPMGLPLFSRMVSGVTWWSMKMHPSMPDVHKRLAAPKKCREVLCERFQVGELCWALQLLQ